MPPIRSAAIRSRAPIPAAAANIPNRLGGKNRRYLPRSLVVGSTRYIGTGIGDKNFIAVSYKSGSDTGLALYGADGGNWTGVWTYASGRAIGAEVWRRE
jgi:hypothetical protein